MNIKPILDSEIYGQIDKILGKEYTSENTFEKDVRKLLNSISNFKVLPKLVSSSERGIPDIIFTVYGKIVGWELKLKEFNFNQLKKDSTLSRQANWLYEASLSGWCVAIVDPNNILCCYMDMIETLFKGSGSKHKDSFLEQYKKEGSKNVH